MVPTHEEYRPDLDSSRIACSEHGLDIVEMAAARVRLGSENYDAVGDVDEERTAVDHPMVATTRSEPA